MKTLDEVIFEAPYSPTPWEADALHYLKEYRSEKAMWEADRKGYLNWIEQYKEAREKHQQAVIELKKNPPLTWDELKGMEYKPVWIEGCGFSHGFWVIIDYFSVGDEDFIALGGKCDQFWKQDMTDENNGESWQAYRKERK